MGGSRIIQWPYFHFPLCLALYQLTYQISKESINVCRIQTKYKCTSFSCSNSQEVKKFLSSLCIANFQLKILKFFFCYRGPETCKKQEISCEIFYNFLIFGGISDYPEALFSFSIMPCPIPTYTPNFKWIHPCLDNPEPINGHHFHAQTAS